jgi:hypothetical protein
MLMAIFWSFGQVAVRVLLPVLLCVVIGSITNASTDAILLAIIAVTLIGWSWLWRTTYICRQVYVVRRDYWNYKIVEAKTYILCQQGELSARYHEVFENFEAAKAYYEKMESYRSEDRREIVHSVYAVEAYKVPGLQKSGQNETTGLLLIITPYKILQDYQHQERDTIYFNREEAWARSEMEKIKDLKNTDEYSERLHAINSDSPARTQARFDPKWGS